MNDSLKRLIIFITTIVILVLALAAEMLYNSNFEYNFRTKLFNKKLQKSELILQNCLEAMQPILASKDHHGSVTENNLFRIAEENKITILEYLDNKLNYWSDNGFSVPVNLTDSLFKKPLIYLQNGWFLTKYIENNDEKIVGLLRLRTDYAFENDILRSGFDKEFRVPQNVGFSLNKEASEFHILDRNGEFLFALIFPEMRKNTGFMILPVFLWTAFCVMLILIAYSLVNYLNSRNRNSFGVLAAILFLFSVYILFFITGGPKILSRTELFSPYRISFNYFIPTLGHLLLFSIIAAFSSHIFYRFLIINKNPARSNLTRFLSLSVLLIVGVLLLLFVNTIFIQMVVGSGINFETYKVLNISTMSIVAYSAILLLMLVPVLYFLKLFQIFSMSLKQTILLLVISVIVPVFLFSNDLVTLFPFIIFEILLIITLLFISVRNSGLFTITVFLSLLVGIYSLFIITIHSEKKNKENIKIQAVAFSTETDPEAEHLLLDIWPLIKKDSILAGMMNVEYFDKRGFDRVSEYLQDTYFTGYWRNFNFNLVLCRNDESLSIGPGNDTFENCFTFFDDRVKMDGHQLTGTDFFFLDNQGGRSYYLGKVIFNTGKKYSNGMFIELYSDINVFQEGYSELLLDKKFHGYSGLKDYSFAKYINGSIVLRTGDYPYEISDLGYLLENSDFRFFNSEGFKHILYRNGNATVIISRPRLTMSDIVISFAYLFAYMLLYYNLLLLIVRRPKLKTVFSFSFRQKLQMSIIGVLLFSFSLVGVVVVSFTVNQYKTKHSENLKDKLNSVYLELESKIAGEKYLSSQSTAQGYATLSDLLIKFSNIFKTDINLYDLQGFLIGTSRPEIFTRDMTSERINNMAIINLKDKNRVEYYQTEKIGSLEYISAYVPFYNSDNDVIAYLNLPYFRMQSVLAREISNVMVAVINFALLFIVITMSIAVIISGRLTAPLTMLGQGLASVGVGRKSEHLSYRGTDEIGELVKQYNRMVDEIEESAIKLANSEREFAWREMAKQIAHEIKNPLTPMKLNVQHLLKSWKDKAPGFDSRIESFTTNQIEYIDNLSSIASSFSAFAKMPGSNPSDVNLIEQIKVILELFNDTENVTFNVKWPAENKIIIHADKEHLNGVFSNLFKNGIQSIPADRKGVIGVKIEARGDKVIVAVSDNGSGIPEELRDKMFTPNFTTKSSGMGLGLSIVKKYLESENGRIWFESEADKGSVFYVELPLKYTVEKPGSNTGRS